MCEIKGLSAINDIVICHCVHCKVVFFWNKNVIINFKQEEFRKFSHSIERMEFDHAAVIFPDERERVIVPTSDSNINLSFDKEAWKDMQAPPQEASCMQEVFELMKL